MQLSERYHDFELISRETIKEVNSEALTFRHRCGARLIILDNEDDHKVFVMGFRTPPPNSTGVAHILEHSVLNGSKEYPVKEPFAELLKGSLQTFLNAITYPDRTLYPVASRNDQDFHNLMDVYLDALCNPLLSEETFLQEGWHFLIDTPESDLRYSGVVYNEMLGAYSDPERLLHREMEQLLFPDTIYGHCSGGEPEHITDLSYAEFQAFYRRYYHPANSLVYLYGTFDITDRLAHLNRYFQRYSYQEINAPITAQSRYHTARQEQAFYPITQAESKEKKVYALQSYLLDNSLEREKSLAFAMLAHILSDTPASPLKKALIDADLAEDVLNYGIDDSILEATYNIGLKGMNEADVPKMEACIETTLRRLVHEGIDPRAIDAALNTVEFSLREANFGSYSKGLIYGLAVQHAWCHRANPLCLLHYEDKLDKIKTAIRKGGYFEEMIERYLLNNPHRATLRLLPDPDYESRRLQQLTNRLTEIKKGFDEETIQGLIKKNQDLQQRQMTPDSPEALNSIPRLPLNCIEKEAECIHFEWLDTTPPRLSWSEQGTQGILYLQLRFDCAGLAERYLPYLPLFAQLCLESGTKKQDYVALTQEIGIHTGGIQASYEAFGRWQEAMTVQSHLVFSAKVLEQKIPELLAILQEILCDLDLSHPKRIGECLSIAKSKLESMLIPSGHAFVTKRLGAYHSRLGRYHELSSGLEQVYFLRKLLQTMKDDPESVLADLSTIRDHVLLGNKLHIHGVGTAREKRHCRDGLNRLIDALPEKALEAEDYVLPSFTANEGILIPSKIQYVGKGANLYALGLRYQADFEVVNFFLSREYLWNKIRVQGGAYGGFSRFDRISGDFYCVSYRDPRLEGSLQDYDGMAACLENLNLSQRDLERLIIATMGQVDVPLTAEQKGNLSLSRYLLNLNQERIQEFRHRILGCRVADFHPYVDLFKQFAKEGSICVFGSEEKLREQKGLFSSLKDGFTD